MAVKIVTGYTGEDHVTAAEDGALNAGLVSTGACVLSTGTGLAATLASANEVIISAGDIVVQGRHVSITGNNSLALDNGGQGVKRRDLVVCRYKKNPTTNAESAELAIVKGTPGADYRTPATADGDIYAGSVLHEEPLYRIDINGLNVSAPVLVCDKADTLIKIKKDLAAYVKAINELIARKFSDLSTDLNTKINNTNTAVSGITDYVVEQGSSGAWEWTKYKSGRAECSCRESRVFSMNAAWNWCYYDKTPLPRMQMPIAFKSRPKFWVTVESGDFDVTVEKDGTETHTPRVWVWSPNNKKNIIASVNYLIKGWWK